LQTTWYLKSANGTAENQPVLIFGETEDTLYSFARQELRNKYEIINNTVTNIINNETVIKNNTLSRINAIEGKYEWGFSFGNNSGNRFVDFIHVNLSYLTNITDDI
jgi:hypothetical protein